MMAPDLEMQLCFKAWSLWGMWCGISPAIPFRCCSLLTVVKSGGKSKNPVAKCQGCVHSRLPVPSTHLPFSPRGSHTVWEVDPGRSGIPGRGEWPLGVRVSSTSFGAQYCLLLRRDVAFEGSTSPTPVI